MAKNIMVNEGSSLKIVKNVSKLSTLLQDNTEQLWVPEDEIKLVPKTIIQDGTYIANREIGNPYGYSEVTVSGVGDLIIGETAKKMFSQNGVYYANEDSSGPYYGYSEVTVNVDSYSGGSSGGSGGQPTSGTVGKDPDGDDAMVVVNPDTGKLEVEKIPVRIEVITPPYNPTGTYNHGQTIEKTGMVVMAYTGDDEEWGEVPIDEIRLDPGIADYDQSYFIDEHGIPSKGFYIDVYDPNRSGDYRSSFTWETVIYGIVGIGFLASNMNTIAYFTRYNDELYGCVKDEGASCTIVSRNGRTESLGYIFRGSPATNFGGCYWNDVIGDICPVSNIDPTDIEYISPQERQVIYVLWNRPGDNKELVTSFNIAVAQPYDPLDWANDDDL